MSAECKENNTNATNEFEREPVPKSHWLGFKSFIGMYAGEHCAGTELMIGPLFVAAGVSAFDLIAGLIVGNLLAVLCWMFMTAPIATRARLTLYCQLEKICGRKLVILYNLANGIMFCFLAGAMITVSATAVGVWARQFGLDFPMPGLNDIYPNSVQWCVAVFAMGAVIAVVAAFGYQTVSKFANIAAPWMVLVFLAFGLISLKQFMDVSGTQVGSLGELWDFAKTELWKGGAPQEGQTKFTFWHVMFFAWFCNMAMHIGMSDLTVFRYAKKSWYASASAAGMFVGHFMAWIAASLLYAYQLRITPENTDVLPGPMAYQAAGLTGLLCVIIAGWTTANPTIYRAGLAFQAIMPKSKRFVVTLCTGLLATVAAMFPGIAMQLLGFVALYGLILMPMGAVVFVDFWLIKRFGLQQYYAEKENKVFNAAAFLTWVITIGICLLLVKWAGIEIYFVSLPGWFIAVGLYLMFSDCYQRLSRTTLTRTIAIVLMGVALCGTIAPSLMFLSGRLNDTEVAAEDAGTVSETPASDDQEAAEVAEEDKGAEVPETAQAAAQMLAEGRESVAMSNMKWMMFYATILWFIVATIAMWKGNGIATAEDDSETDAEA